jgi:hypothetical protein
MSTADFRYLMGNGFLSLILSTTLYGTLARGEVRPNEAEYDGTSGVYVVLFVLAIWSTYQQQSPAYRRMRVLALLTSVLFFPHFTPGHSRYTCS